MRFTFDKQPVLVPFYDSVQERFNNWLVAKQKGITLGSMKPGLNRDQAADLMVRTPIGGVSAALPTVSPFTVDQRGWRDRIGDHIFNAISIEREDLELSTFNQPGGLGRAHQLFGDQIPIQLDELNEVLAA